MTGEVRPRIHWVSPLPPQETDIAHYTRRILPDLAERADVVLWTDAEDWDREIEEIAAVRRCYPHTGFPMDFASLPPTYGAPEFAFHNLGNSWVYHAGIFHLTYKMPGCIVLHDLAVQEFFRDMVAFGQLSKRAYLRGMKRAYGRSGKVIAKAVLSGLPLPVDLLRRFPGFELCLDRARGVLVHTGAAARKVSDFGKVPVHEAPLPFALGPERPAERAAEGKLHLVQFGHIGPNRRMAEVLRVLAGLKDELNFQLDIYGNIWKPEAIEPLIPELGLQEHVTIHGFVPEPELDAALARAHLVINLRYPSMGEASGSQLRIWNASATAVVSDLAWYRGLPDSTVLKVPHAGEAEALSALIRRVDANRGLCAEIGAAGRAYFEAHHGTAAYADRLVEIARTHAAEDRKALRKRAINWALACAPRPALFRPGLDEAMGD